MSIYVTCYASFMTTRNRPADCCDIPITYAPMSDERQREIVAVFKALGDGTRLEIFRLIASQSAPICVCDITERFSVSQPTISHHLKVLREAGLIDVSRRGNWAYYAPARCGLDLLSGLTGRMELPEMAAI
jgi:ArsR family transcriptional regulator, arsenate/arsenite/antimonite-responsive transcriptional repressor